MIHFQFLHHNQSMSSLSLIEVYRDTLQRCKELEKAPISHKMTFVKNFDLTYFHVEEKTEIIVENMDTLCAAELYHSPDIVILNFASEMNPGGGVIRGSSAQEEELFRRTNYHQTLSSHFYRLQFNECVYSPTIHIVKSKTYKWLEHHISISSIACAAIRYPKIDPDNVTKYKRIKDRESMRLKIEHILQVAINMRHRTIVLGAFGCGAFRNPPEEVALLFQSALKKFGHYFRRIIFAILEEGKNLHVFKQTFEK